ncbi:MAG: hypothetical protein ACLGHJ_02300 [Gammaproteobacteria bacterium]
MDRNALADALANLMSLGGDGDPTPVLSVAQMFLLALAVLVFLVVLGALAAMINRWLEHGLDKVFEVLLAVVLVAVLVWMYVGGYFRLM